MSKPGQFPCKVLLHVCGQRDTGVIEELVRKIIDYCENFGFVSVAIPAICAGKHFLPYICFKSHSTSDAWFRQSTESGIAF